MLFLLVAATILIGTLLPVQAGLNAELTRTLQHPFAGAFISFFTGALVLGVIILIHPAPVGDLRRLTTLSPQYFLGGALGALFVGSSIFLFPRIGATTMMAAFVTGQLISSVIMDHNGWLGLPVYQVNWVRIIGIILLFSGLFLVVKKPS